MPIVKYSKDHEYIAVDGDVGTVGISVHAQQQLGDVVFVDPPSPGRKVQAHEVVAVVESVKAASDVYSPVSGEVIEMNTALADKPATVNEDAEGKGWFFKIKLSNKAELDALMDKAAYDKFCASA
jgi:glycine cleavage system H protein